jgi:hypothetical protein
MNIYSLIAAMLVSSPQAPTYSFNQFPTRNGVAFQSIVSVSDHGRYLLAEGSDTQGRTHYLLYGPDFTQTPQDLSTSAGPNGPNTNVPWSGNYIAVNDKGHCVATTSPTPLYTETISDLYLYEHETHTLTPVTHVAGAVYLEFDPPVISDRDTIAGTLACNYANGNWTVSRPFRWSQAAGLKTLFTGGAYFGATTVINENDYQAAYISPDPNCLLDSTINYTGSTYLVGSPTLFTDGNSQDGIFPFALNDSQTVGGMVFSWTGVEFFESPFHYVPGSGPNVVLLGSISGFESVAAVDNFGRAFGFDNGGSQTEYLLWPALAPGEAPINVATLIPSSDQSLGSWSFASMDLNGVIYGAYSDASGNPHLISLSPSN